VTYANSTPNESSGYAETSAPAAAQQYNFVEHLHLAIALIERRLKEACPGIAYDVHGARLSGFAYYFPSGANRSEFAVENFFI